MKPVLRPSRQRLATMEQDKAAGGIDRRKIRTRSGGVAVASLAVVESGEAWRVILRFKWGGSNVQRPVGTVAASTRQEALLLGWQLVRSTAIVESNGWSWAASENGG